MQLSHPQAMRLFHSRQDCLCFVAAHLKFSAFFWENRLHLYVFVICSQTCTFQTHSGSKCFKGKLNLPDCSGISDIIVNLLTHSHIQDTPALNSKLRAHLWWFLSPATSTLYGVKAVQVKIYTVCKTTKHMGHFI